VHHSNTKSLTNDSHTNLLGSAAKRSIIARCVIASSFLALLFSLSALVESVFPFLGLDFLLLFQSTSSHQFHKWLGNVYVLFYPVSQSVCKCQPYSKRHVLRYILEICSFVSFKVCHLELLHQFFSILNFQCFFMSLSLS
jgi:hypothetical protein